MNKKNLLLVINQLYGGGAQKVIANLSVQLAEIGNVTLLVYNDTDKIVFPYAGELLKLNLPYPENTQDNPFFKRLIRFFSLIRQLRKIKKERNIDVSEWFSFSNVVVAKRKIISNHLVACWGYRYPWASATRRLPPSWSFFCLHFVVPLS